MEIKYLLLIGYLLCVWYVHTKGNARLPLRRQMFDHSTILAPYNILMDFSSAVPRTPIQDRSDFPNLDYLKDNVNVFRREAMGLYSENQITESAERADVAFNSFFRRGWRRFYLKWYDDPMPSAWELCPESTKIISEMPQINAAMFALLPAGGILGKHRDPFGGSLRYHLGLATPNSDDCFIRIDGQVYSWRDGEDIVFDETYLHDAHNETDQDRIILFCDVTRPLRFGWARRLNEFAIKRVLKVTKSRNTQEETVGGLNRVAGKAYAAKKFFENVKAYNWKLYYVAEYLLFGAIIYLIFF